MLTTCPPYLPPGDGGPTDHFRRSVARFATGPAHTSRRAAVESVLAGLDLADLRARAAATGDATAALAGALGLPDEIVPLVPTIAAVYQGGSADEAVSRALQLAGAGDEAVARLTVLVQACTATAALADAASAQPRPADSAVVAALDPPPVPETRRVLPDGTVVSVDLTGTPFGAGPHRCPGEPHALALAAGLVDRVSSLEGRRS